MRLARVLGGIGRTMITAGTLILLFVAYQLWGTGIREAQAQDRLENQFKARMATTTTTASTTPETTPPSTAPPVPIVENKGDVVGKIEMPTIDETAYVVEGVDVLDLQKGPGHYPNTPFPGQKGNAAIAGHRTTYGAPFADIDSLKVGDKITVTTVQGTFTYAVMAQDDGSAHRIVSPSQVDVLDDKGDNRLTLTACHPKYSASQRIVVNALLQGNPLPASKPVSPAASLDAGVSGKEVGRLPAILWALVCAAIWLGAWAFGKWVWRKWPSYVVAFPFFMVALFFFFENFSRLLPANY